MSGLEIIGLISSIIEFVEIGIETGSRVKDFLDAAQEGPEAFRDLVIVLQLLKLSLQSTKTSVEQGNTNSEGRETVLIVVTRCNQHVTALNALLEKCIPAKGDSSVRVALKAVYSLLREKKINELLGKLLTLRDALTDFNVSSRNSSSKATSEGSPLEGSVEVSVKIETEGAEGFDSISQITHREEQLLAELGTGGVKKVKDTETLKNEVEKEEECLKPVDDLIEAEVSQNCETQSLSEDQRSPEHPQTRAPTSQGSKSTKTTPLAAAEASKQDIQVKENISNLSVASSTNAAASAKMSPKTPQISSALNAVAKAGKIEVIRLLLNLVKDEESKKSLASTALLETAGWRWATPEAVATLLELGASGATKGVLHRAAQEGNTAIASLLLEAGAEPDTTFSNEGVAMNVAAMHGHFSIAKQLLAAGANPNGTGEGDWLYGTPINTAIRCRHEDIALALLTAGADPKQPSTLQFAAACNQIAVIKDLLDRGADVDFASAGKTPLAEAAKNGNNDMIELLIDRGADPNTQFDGGNSALACAILHNNVKGALLLTAKGADPNTKDLLARAAGKNLTEVVDAMINAGGNVNSEGGVGGTVLITAIIEGRTDMVKHLLEKGADTNRPGGVYRFPLIAAISLRSEALAEDMALILLEAGADPNTPGAFEKAAEQGLARVLEFMSTRL